MSDSKTRTWGYECNVRGCPQKNNRRFSSLKGFLMHLEAKHPGVAEKRLKPKISSRYLEKLKKQIKKRVDAAPG
ncbi:MAG: hypothetical protein JSU85_04860 [Candidatus Zixiibacteriota bacterium]|nr:MAG: hypothetical protein JSU85_04860 [candidate division Zixibacteria bacterium]